jgi:hypothetical protein
MKRREMYLQVKFVLDVKYRDNNRGGGESHHDTYRYVNRSDSEASQSFSPFVTGACWKDMEEVEVQVRVSVIDFALR